MYQLYYSPGACSMAVHICALECGEQVELINASISEGKTRSPEFLKMNPRGQVPVLVDNGLVIREGAAQMVYMMDKHNCALLPKSGEARARALEWLMWGNATLHVAYSKAFMMKKAFPDEAMQKIGSAFCCQQIQKLWDEAEVHLQNNAFLAGAECTMADILMTVIANWSTNLSTPIKFGPNVQRVIKACLARPTYQAALASENVTYKVAA